MIELDLTGADSPETYSEETLEKAREVIRRQSYRLFRKRGTALVRSLRTYGPDYHPAASRDANGNIAGITCNCANGRKGGARARCYHAAALELLLNGDNA